MTDLRERIVDAVSEYTADPWALADRILALLPPSPKLAGAGHRREHDRDETSRSRGLRPALCERGVMSNRDELRENLISIVLEFADAVYENFDEAGAIADRILALLPPQPKLEWRGHNLFFGCLETTGWIAGHGDRCDARFDRRSVLPGDFVPEQEARAAVEDAVRKALGWPK